MAKKRQVVLINPDRESDENGMLPLGSFDDVNEVLSGVNIAHDGSKRSAETGTIIMHGPGLVAEIATGVEPVSQVMVTMKDEDMAWPVLMRLCTRVKWAMMDLETGRTFGPGH